MDFPQETGSCRSLGRMGSSYHWHSHSTHFRPRTSGFASCNPHCSWPPPSGKRSRPWALQQATSTLFGSPSLPASLNGTCIHILCSICRAIGQIQHFFRSGGINFTERFREDRLLVKKNIFFRIKGKIYVNLQDFNKILCIWQVPLSNEPSIFWWHILMKSFLPF